MNNDMRLRSSSSSSPISRPDFAKSDSMQPRFKLLDRYYKAIAEGRKEDFHDFEHFAGEINEISKKVFNELKNIPLDQQQLAQQQFSEYLNEKNLWVVSALKDEGVAIQDITNIANTLAKVYGDVYPKKAAQAPPAQGNIITSAWEWVTNKAISIAGEVVETIDQVQKHLDPDQLGQNYLKPLATDISPESLLPEYRNLDALVEKLLLEKPEEEEVKAEGKDIKKSSIDTALKVINFNENILEPVKHKMNILTSDGNFQQLIGAGMNGIADCIEKANKVNHTFEDSMKPDLSKENKEKIQDAKIRTFVRELDPSVNSVEEFRNKTVKSIRKNTKQLLKGKIDNEQKAKISKNLFKLISSKFRRFLSNVAMSVVQKQVGNQFAQLDTLIEGKSVSQIQKIVEEKTPMIATVLNDTNSWEKLESFEGYADVAFLHILEQMIHEGNIILYQPQEAKQDTEAQKGNFKQATDRFLNAVNSLKTEEEGLFNDVFRFGIDVATVEFAKPMDWNKHFISPLRENWNAWISGSSPPPADEAEPVKEAA